MAKPVMTATPSLKPVLTVKPNAKFALPTALLQDGETSYCGDNLVLDGEACDDGNLEINDGCNDICQIENGFNYDANGCAPICGDNLKVNGEACDDGNLEINDGCNDICQIEDGFNYDLEGCTPICGDNLQVNCGSL